MRYFSVNSNDIYNTQWRYQFDAGVRVGVYILLTLFVGMLLVQGWSHATPVDHGAVHNNAPKTHVASRGVDKAHASLRDSNSIDLPSKKSVKENTSHCHSTSQIEPNILPEQGENCCGDDCTCSIQHCFGSTLAMLPIVSHLDLLLYPTVSFASSFGQVSKRHFKQYRPPRTFS